MFNSCLPGRISIVLILCAYIYIFACIHPFTYMQKYISSLQVFTIWYTAVKMAYVYFIFFQTQTACTLRNRGGLERVKLKLWNSNKTVLDCMVQQKKTEGGFTNHDIAWKCVQGDVMN